MDMKMGRLKVAGVVLILLGILLPWRCYTGSILGCDQLLYHDSLGSIILDPTWVVIFIVLIALMLLLLNAAGFNLKQMVLAFASLFYCGVLSIKLPDYYPRGPYLLSNEFLVLVLSSLTTWLALYSSFRKDRNAHRYLIIGSLALALVSAITISQTLYAQFINTPLDGQMKLQIGLPLILLGALMIAISRPIIEFLGNRTAIHAFHKRAV